MDNKIKNTTKIVRENIHQKLLSGAMGSIGLIGGSNMFFKLSIEGLNVISPSETKLSVFEEIVIFISSKLLIHPL